MTHLSAVVLQDLAHHRDRHLAQVTRDPLLLREGMLWDVAMVPRTQNSPLHHKNPPLRGTWEHPGGTHSFLSLTLQTHWLPKSISGCSAWGWPG